ncbi:MAG: WYL domain-containing protein [Cyanobacteria bacterium REEB67]|nr:WYL domain-containing protein [Cyanobacteria bacterium REEB67]
MTVLPNCNAQAGPEVDLHSARTTTLPADGDSLDDIVFVAFDTETTGLSPIACRLVELCAVKFRLGDGEPETFETLINPGQPIPPEVSALHGISDEMVKDAPLAGPALTRFFDWLGGSAPVLMAHNANFDVEFVKVEAMRAGLSMPQNFVLDTLVFAQNHVNDCANYKLKTLSEYFGFAGALYHRALDDSIYVEKLFRKLLERSAHKTFGELRAGGSLSVFGALPQVSGRERLSQNALAMLATLEEAIGGGGEAEVRLTYHSEFKSTRVVMPLAVIESRGSVYLNAFCKKSQAERTFRVDRIVEAILLSRKR